MCDTTYRTGLHDNCGLKNFQRAISTGHEHSTLNKTGFENQYVLDERTRRRLAEVILPSETFASREQLSTITQSVLSAKLTFYFVL